jgi:probable phosphoglycerate mutase
LVTSAKTLFLIRHGQTEWNASGRMQGRLDSPLTVTGRAQANAHGAAVQALGGVEAVIVSPLGRTRETAAIVNAHLQAPVEFEPALMERDCGLWSGLIAEEIEAAYPDSWRARSEDPYFHRPPGGENHADMRERVSGFLTALVRRPEARLALVTHGIMSRVILGHFLALPPDETARVRHPNELFYRIDLLAGDVRSVYFVAGEGPFAGLLRHAD